MVSAVLRAIIPSILLPSTCPPFYQKLGQDGVFRGAPLSGDRLRATFAVGMMVVVYNMRRLAFLGA